MFNLLKNLFKKPETLKPRGFPRADIPDEGPFVIAHWDPPTGSIRVWEGFATRHDGIYTIWYNEHGMKQRFRSGPNFR